MSLGAFTGDTVGVASRGSDLNRIEPGDHEASYLWNKINGTQGDVGGGGGQMPQGRAPLSQAEIDGIAGYIDSL